MLYVLGIGSAIALAGSLITIIRDQFPNLKHIYVVLGTVTFGFCAGIIYCTPVSQNKITEKGIQRNIYWLVNFLFFFFILGWSIHAGIGRLLRSIFRGIHPGHSRDNWYLLDLWVRKFLGWCGIHVEEKAVGLLEVLLGCDYSTFAGCDPSLYLNQFDTLDIQWYLLSWQCTWYIFILLIIILEYNEKWSFSQKDGIIKLKSILCERKFIVVIYSCWMDHLRIWYPTSTILDDLHHDVQKKFILARGTFHYSIFWKKRGKNGRMTK